ncbi:DUF7594 domain-containing protein [Rubellicoccus peritrichatus]|uniref:Family 16 glycosylhydrolase n=1 Tax=Rubellicoccus peritrichatus TaxID=3080537 RepID=A0AAQ3QS85_9BACT|nr:DNRLRE domain-containing protein [Puniceicoccus sp. CR14]WOO40096.1 family 16 glycosylhydrolase [Puniceicoccus sp. CR14]
MNAAPPPGNFTLTFEDQFNGTYLDGAIWRQGIHDGSPAGYSTSGTGAAIKRENIEVDNGVLRLTAKQESGTQNNLNFNYTSGEVSTFRSFSRSTGDQGFKQTYGYIEARMRWDSVQGLWPAFWTMPDRGLYGYQNYFNRSFLKFDLTGVSLSGITSATLRLKVAGIQNTSPGLYDGKTNTVVMGVHDDSWVESGSGGITWNNMPMPDPRWLDQKYDNRTIGSTVDLDVTEFIAEQVGDSDKVFTLLLTDTLRQWNWVDYHSREAAISSNRPVLIVNGISYQAVADARVAAGTVANTNYGTQDTLRVWEVYQTGNEVTTVDSGGGKGMEIDIMEVLGKWGSNVTGSVLHWNGYTNGISNDSTGWGRMPVQDTSVFHEYGVYWEDGLLEFYVDGVKTATYEDSRAPSVPAYLIFSLQTGGWDNNTPSSAINGKSLEVDWVRVWSGTKSGSTQSSTSINGNGDVTFGEDYSVYGGSGNAGAKVTLADDGDVFAASLNGWVKFPLSYTVTADTWVDLTIDSSNVGEVLAFGLDENDNASDTKRLFQLAGSFTWANAWQDANDYIAETGPLTYSLNVGSFYTGAMSYLALASDDDANSKIYTRYSNVRIYESTGGGGPGATINIGSLNSGVAALDSRSGTGYLMYSAQNVITRFGAYTGNADHIIAVIWNGSAWYADTNFGQVAFTPVSTDVLLATVDFTNDTVVSLEGSAGIEYGIDYGYYSGDLVYTANMWNGSSNSGEFGVSGTSFSLNGSGASPINIGALNSGIAAVDGRTGTGYLMYSDQNVITRFGAYTGNSDHVIAVIWNGSAWYADTNFSQVAFTPVSTDILLATVDFTNDSVGSLEGTNSTFNGIQEGYASGDLGYIADWWNGGSNDGEFTVTGTTFTPW